MIKTIVPQMWPRSCLCAVSICFDDGLSSQISLALPLLNEYKIASTFYLTSAWMEDLDHSWKRRMISPWVDASMAGHEIGNHTRYHPCTANFEWTKHIPCGPLERMCLATMEAEIDAAQLTLTAEIGVAPTTFAYPCGMTFVGSGACCRSYVPLVATKFLVGRRYNDECAATPLHCDLAQVPAVRLDNRCISELINLLEKACHDGSWLIFVAHSIGYLPATLSTEFGVLKSLLEHLAVNCGTIWVDTVRNVGLRVRDIQTLHRSPDR